MNPPRPARPVVVLVNLGTPAAPTAKAVRRYLAEFLSDRRVIEMHPALWWPILHGIILRVRPRASAQKYASIWTDQGSPLLIATEALRRNVAELLRGVADVFIGMRYGEPSLSSLLTQLRTTGRKRVLIVPLYPQYAASSTGSVLDAVSRWSLRSRDQLELRTLRAFPEHDAYLDAVVTGIRAAWSRHSQPNFAAGDRLLLSFHSIPVAMHQAGDPYRSECLASAEGIRARLGLNEQEAPTTFQSVFGPAAWLTPATIDTVRALGTSGTRRVDVVCPGFAADCLETLEEIDVQNRAAFLESGGAEFHYLPWTTTPAWPAALATIIRTALAGWAPHAYEVDEKPHPGDILAT